MAEQSSDVKNSDNSAGGHKLGLISLIAIVVGWEAAFSVCRKTRRPLLH